MEQNCISTNLPSRERGGRGPKIIPPCIDMKKPFDEQGEAGGIPIIVSVYSRYVPSKDLLFVFFHK